MREMRWVQWLQNVVNISKIVELGAFVFRAYQFWKNRRERNAADAIAAQRAIIDSNYQAWQVINSAQGKGGSGGQTLPTPISPTPACPRPPLMVPTSLMSLVGATFVRSVTPVSKPFATHRLVLSSLPAPTARWTW